MGQSLVLNGFTSFTKDSCDFVDPQCVAVKYRVGDEAETA